MSSLHPDQIRELALAIASEQIASSWIFFLVWFLATIVAGALGAWLAGFFRKRGENYATKTDFTDLMEQLKRTTETAENVRTAIAHTDWAAREWKTLRRTKAEELLIEVEKATRDFDLLGVDYLFNELHVHHDLGAQIHTLALLYFPEALIPTIHLCALLNEGVNLLLDIRTDMRNEGIPITESLVRRRRMPEVISHRERMYQPKDQIQEIVRRAMWTSFGLPEHEFDANQALAVVNSLTPPPPQTPSAPSAASPRA